MDTENKNNRMVTVEEMQDVKNHNHEGAEESLDLVTLEKVSIDWVKIKSEYLCGAGPKFLSEKYKINIETIHSRIYREKWNNEKRETSENVKLRVREKYSETLTEIQIKTREEYLQAYSQIRKKMMQMIHQTNDAKDLYTITKALNESMKQEFICLGIHDGTNENLGSIIRPQPIGEKNESLEKSNQELDLESFKKLIVKLRNFI